jgi:hypothetical protein
MFITHCYCFGVNIFCIIWIWNQPASPSSDVIRSCALLWTILTFYFTIWRWRVLWRQSYVAYLAYHLEEQRLYARGRYNLIMIFHGTDVFSHSLTSAVELLNDWMCQQNYCVKHGEINWMIVFTFWQTWLLFAPVQCMHLFFGLYFCILSLLFSIPLKIEAV